MTWLGFCASLCSVALRFEASSGGCRFVGFHIFICLVSLSRVAVVDLCFQWDAWGAIASEQRGKVTYHPEGYSMETRGGGRHVKSSR
ncbi:hypothetical protein SESBI_46012 [Sesbania bispinosa]|nr:hypothetical protein SESBI_46012 [Sesbania bispinosa]